MMKAGSSGARRTSRTYLSQAATAQHRADSAQGTPIVKASSRLHLVFFDRILMATETAQIETIMVVNKSDLESHEDALEQLAPMRDLGYLVLSTSAADGTEPPTDNQADGAYREHLARVLTARALVAAGG